MLQRPLGPREELVGQLVFVARFVGRRLKWSRLYNRPPPDVAVVKDLGYGSAQGSTLDVYQPPGQGPRPVAVFVYGGAWGSGNKGLYAAVGLELAPPWRDGVGVDGGMRHPRVGAQGKAALTLCDSCGFV